MTCHLTLIASMPNALTPRMVEPAFATLKQQGIPFDRNKVRVLSPGRALAFPVFHDMGFHEMSHLRAALAPHRIDALIRPGGAALPRALIADMDATILQGETLDEIAAHVGVGDQVAAITARAMRGELDFRAALAERLALVTGMPESLLDQVWAAQRFSKGAATLIASLRARGVTCVLVSGGFTFFTRRVAEALGFHHHHSNLLTFENGRSTAALTEPLIDKQAKHALLDHYTRALNIPVTQIMAVGDGANDLPLLQNAGFGFGYHPKPILRETLINQVLYGDLTALLYAIGLNDSQIVETPDPAPLP